MRGVNSLSLALWLVLALPPTAGAETVYVTDRLSVGIHAERALDSAIVNVLPTGTPLDVLAREGEFARVRTPDGITGWVDVNYVTNKQPVQLAAAELQAKHKQTAAELERARAELKQVKAQLATAQARPAGSPAPNTSAALRELEKLAVENRELKRRLAEVRARSTDDNPGGTAQELLEVQANPLGGLDPTSLQLTKWHWIALGFAFLLAFALGGYWVDYQVRRRHGGFRV